MPTVTEPHSRWMVRTTGQVLYVVYAADLDDVERMLWSRGERLASAVAVEWVPASETPGEGL